jgi:hypothetical protein
MLIVVYDCYKFVRGDVEFVKIKNGFLANHALKNDTLKNYTAHPGTNLTNIVSL